MPFFKIKDDLYIVSVDGTYSLHNQSNSSCEYAICCNFFFDNVCKFPPFTLNKRISVYCPRLSINDYLEQNQDIKEFINIKLEEATFIDL